MALGFHDVQFPTDVSFGSSGGPEFKTHLFMAHSGAEKRNVEWSQPMMKFNVAYGIKTDTQMMKVLEFFNARQGRAYAFRYKNWGNFQVTASPIATGDGISQRLPLWKFYGYQGAQQYKRLYKIVPGSVSGVGVGSVGALVEGVDYRINYNEGEIAFNTVPGYGVPIFGTLEFDEPVRFEEDNVQAMIDGFNNNTLTRLDLVSVRAPFTSGNVFSPSQPSGTDILFDKVRLLLNFDDVSVLTTTVDSSNSGAPVTFTGDAALTTSAFQSGSGSLSLGSTGALTTTGVPYNLSAQQPFTLEIFAQQPPETVTAETQQLIGKWDASINQRCWVLRYQRATKELQFVVSSNGTSERVLMTVPWTMSTATGFDYITIDRLPNNWYVMRIRGEVVATRQDSGVVQDIPTQPLSIGRTQNPTSTEGTFGGLIDSVRFTIGQTRHNNLNAISIPGPYPTSG